jgi:hypothetical protein
MRSSLENNFNLEISEIHPDRRLKSFMEDDDEILKQKNEELKIELEKL